MDSKQEELSILEHMMFFQLKREYGISKPFNHLGRWQTQTWQLPAGHSKSSLLSKVIDEFKVKHPELCTDYYKLKNAVRTALLTSIHYELIDKLIANGLQDRVNDIPYIIFEAYGGDTSFHIRMAVSNGDSGIVSIQRSGMLDNETIEKLANEYENPNSRT